jgi:hypothetical protein
VQQKVEDSVADANNFLINYGSKAIEEGGLRREGYPRDSAARCVGAGVKEKNDERTKRI